MLQKTPNLIVSNKKVGRCPKTDFASVTVDDLKKYKGEIFNVGTIENTFSSMKNEPPHACSQCNIYYSK